MLKKSSLTSLDSLKKEFTPCSCHTRLWLQSDRTAPIGPLFKAHLHQPACRWPVAGGGQSAEGGSVAAVAGAALD